MIMNMPIPKKMRILAIETSCDETAVSIVDASGSSFKVLSDMVISQIDIHKPYGGVFPALAKREHAKNLVPMLAGSLEKAKLSKLSKGDISIVPQVSGIMEREPELLTAFTAFVPTIVRPNIDIIAFTYGPGLPPALWVGLNFARALSLQWNIPLIPVNHMEGHAFSAMLYRKENSNFKFKFPKTPILALLISGGHTQIVLVKDIFKYKIIGETRDDAVGEAFDKAARILGLPYPGGPEVSKCAQKFRESGKEPSGKYKLPRPMIHSGDLDLSFSGIKTAVLYMVQKIKYMDEDIREEICWEFEEAVTETLLSKMLRAAEKHNPETVILGGGVSANSYIQKKFRETFETEFPETKILVPERSLTGDNALMIAAAGYMRASLDAKSVIPPGSKKISAMKADGNLSL